MDTRQRSSASRHFEDALREKIVGQDDAVQALVEFYQIFCAGLHSPGRPVGNLLFLGPTGSGKTRIVEAAAEILFGESRAVIKVDCAEFQHSHEIAKLIGSPPGYLGHRETHPLITQEALAASHTDKLKLSFLLFDEIEKASDSLWQLLLGMLDKATLTLGDNRRVDLSQTVIFLADGGGSGAAEVFAGVYEPARYSGGLSPIEARGTRRSAGDGAGASAEARIGFDGPPLRVPNHDQRTAVPARRGDRPEVWSAPPKARHRALCGLPAREAPGNGTSASG